MLAREVYRGHVVPIAAVRLRGRQRRAQRVIRAFDRDLRLRRSLEMPGAFVLERRQRAAPRVNHLMRPQSDMHVQARDGYIHVALVHPNWLRRPESLGPELLAQGFDLWAMGGADRVANELEYEEEWAKESRRRRRRQRFRDIALESFDVLNRLGNRDGTERTRISNAGMPTS